jgi:gamma-glutamylcyclotransferase (GGCT)/AIG2-like uncharacterized protein YtfP
MEQPINADMALRHLFVYGSLVDARCLDEVLGHAHDGERLAARLGGYARVATDAYPYPYIVPAPARAVDGILVMNLSARDFERLDRYEDLDTGVYARELVEVEAWGCGPSSQRADAFTYVAGPVLAKIASTAN